MTLDISSYVTLHDAGIEFSEAHASQFAKHIAGDFNPIHDVGAKRFCVPGDLLFGALLDRYGVFENIKVDLMSLLSANVVVKLPTKLEGHNEICDAEGRHLITLDVSGDQSNDSLFTANLVEQYVKFSGKTFPDILVGLMRENNVMINPARPLVIYKDMSLNLEKMSASNLSLELDTATLEAEGKKGKACLRFVIKDNDDIIGRGEKNMLLSGLRDFDESAMSDIVAQYNEWKTAFTADPQI